MSSICYGFSVEVYLNFLNFNLKKAFLITLVIALPLISINMEQKASSEIWFNKPFTFLAQSMQNMFFQFSSGVRSSASDYLNLMSIKAKIKALQKENDQIKTQLNLLNESQNEVERLRSLLDFQKNTKMELIPAQVIGRDLVNDHNTITINKGTDHGLIAGQAVLTVSGAVGHVFRPTAKFSHILLITDRYSVVDAIVQKSRAHGLVEGKTKESCQLRYVERTEEVKNGDLIVTGGLDNIFPKGFPLGVITNVERKSKSASLIVDVNPVVDANKVEEVFVVKSAAQENFMQEIQTNKLKNENKETLNE